MAKIFIVAIGFVIGNSAFAGEIDGKWMFEKTVVYGTGGSLYDKPTVFQDRY